MTFLDKVYRDYVYKHKFKQNNILEIKSVAYSGKTTTLEIYQFLSLVPPE